jgi:hypothetical protein
MISQMWFLGTITFSSLMHLSCMEYWQACQWIASIICLRVSGLRPRTTVSPIPVLDDIFLSSNDRTQAGNYFPIDSHVRSRPPDPMLFVLRSVDGEMLRDNRRVSTNTNPYSNEWTIKWSMRSTKESIVEWTKRRATVISRHASLHTPCVLRHQRPLDMSLTCWQ